jgi:hypothetical protein
MARMHGLRADLIGTALLMIVLAVPAQAQKKEKEKDRGNDRRAPQGQVDRWNEARPDLVRRNGDRYEVEQRRDGQDRARGNGAGKVPPGWCRGQGNPHNTPANCGFADWRRDRDGWSIGDRRYRSFEEAHEVFHRHHDRECRLRAAERPLDPSWQLRVRAECRAEHDAWHARNDPNQRRHE